MRSVILVAGIAPTLRARVKSSSNGAGSDSTRCFAFGSSRLEQLLAASALLLLVHETIATIESTWGQQGSVHLDRAFGVNSVLDW